MKFYCILFFFHIMQKTLWIMKIWGKKMTGGCKILEITRVAPCKFVWITHLKRIQKSNIIITLRKNEFYILNQKTFYWFIGLKKKESKIILCEPISHYIAHRAFFCNGAKIWMTPRVWSSVSSDSWTRLGRECNRIFLTEQLQEKLRTKSFVVVSGKTTTSTVRSLRMQNDIVTFLGQQSQNYKTRGCWIQSRRMQSNPELQKQS